MKINIFCLNLKNIKKSNAPNQTEKELMIMLLIYCAIGICEMWNKNV